MIIPNSNDAIANPEFGPMSWLLFIDESGHDHRTMPLEVRGGVGYPRR